MCKDIKIGLLGGDLRQVALAAALAKKGAESALWGIDDTALDLEGAVRCGDWRDSVRDARAVVLPLPISKDGLTLNCPLYKGRSLDIETLFDELSSNVIVFGGLADEKFKERAKKVGIYCYDYYENEEFQLKNAIPSAEGAIEYAMRLFPKTIFSSDVAVIGYGRIGRVLSEMLKALNSHVTVFARKNTDVVKAALSGCRSEKIYEKDWHKELSKFDLVFNTVPVRLLSVDMLKNIGKHPIYVDLVSSPGGIDCQAAREFGIIAEKALSLPGKVAPVTAGEIICDCILSVLNENETEERG